MSRPGSEAMVWLRRGVGAEGQDAVVGCWLGFCGVCAVEGSRLLRGSRGWGGFSLVLGKS